MGELVSTRTRGPDSSSHALLHFPEGPPSLHARKRKADAQERPKRCQEGLDKPGLPQGAYRKETSCALSEDKGAGRERAKSETYKAGLEGILECQLASVGMGNSLPTRQLMRAEQIAWYGGATVGSGVMQKWV